MATIDLAKLGLTEESTLAEIQAKLNEQKFFDEAEVTEAKNTAASGARKAAAAKLGKNSLSDEDMEAYNTYKTDTKMSAIKNNETIKKFSDEDQDLIIGSTKLMELDGEELETAIEAAGTKYAKRMLNNLPKELTPEELEAQKTKEELEDSAWD